jgi:hypothetical protein
MQPDAAPAFGPLSAFGWMAGTAGLASTNISRDGALGARAVFGPGCPTGPTEPDVQDASRCLGLVPQGIRASPGPETLRALSTLAVMGPMDPGRPASAEPEARIGIPRVWRSEALCYEELRLLRSGCSMRNA